MSDTAIRIDNVSKKYLIGNTSNGSLRETIANVFSSNHRSKTEEFWALKDVSFEVKRGEAIGIIGKNGAGKSTLLKILSRITEPTKGRVEIEGRVSSLLEVGTGFHPELTGRENVFLNGTVLGMKRQEIKDKFDEIVDFSGVERFLDTPVKRYSSGMKVRLAFAVAAHLEPEILIIDEVLAVGDAEFQKKCLGKMQDVAGQGRTVLFVSHNMGAVVDLCSKCIALESGKKVFEGEVSEGVKKYIQGGVNHTNFTDLENRNIDRTFHGPMRISSLRILNDQGTECYNFKYGDDIVFEVAFKGKIGETAILGLAIRNALGDRVIHLNNTDDKFKIHINDQSTTIKVQMLENILNDGDYYVSVWLGDEMNNLNDVLKNCTSFVVDSSEQGKIRSLGLVRVKSKWYSL